jgi:Pectate lyase superfamily protein
LVENRYKLIANIKHKRYGGIIPAVTANDNVIFEIELYDDVLPYDLTGVTRCTLVTMKKNKSSVIREGTLSNGLIKFTLSGSETTESGRVEGTVQLYDATNKRVSSAPLAYEVIRDPSLLGGLPADDKTLVIANEALLTESIEKSDQAMARVDELITKAPQPSEVVDARGGEVTLGARLNSLSSSVAQIATNVKSLGAKGDGITDDTLAIQTALDIGGTIYFPKGVYIINKPVGKTNIFWLTKNATLYGEGNESVIKIGNGNEYRSVLAAEVGDLILTVRDLKFDANGIDNPQTVHDGEDRFTGLPTYKAMCLKLDAGSLYVYNTEFVDFYGTNVVFFEQHSDNTNNSYVVVEGCRFLDIGDEYGQGIHDHSTLLAHKDPSIPKQQTLDISIKNNIFKAKYVGAPNAFCALEMGSERCEFSNNKVIGYFQGSLTLPKCQNSKTYIQNNIFEDVGIAYVPWTKVFAGYQEPFPNDSYAHDELVITGNTMNISPGKFKDKINYSEHDLVDGFYPHNYGGIRFFETTKKVKSLVIEDNIIEFNHDGTMPLSAYKEAYGNGIRMYKATTAFTFDKIKIHNNSFRNIPFSSIRLENESSKEIIISDNVFSNVNLLNTGGVNNDNVIYLQQSSVGNKIIEIINNKVLSGSHSGFWNINSTDTNAVYGKLISAHNVFNPSVNSSGLGGVSIKFSDVYIDDIINDVLLNKYIAIRIAVASFQHSVNFKFMNNAELRNSLLNYKDVTFPTVSGDLYYQKGDIIYNSNPNTGGYVGWICTTTGRPGTWKEFGVISKAKSGTLTYSADGVATTKSIPHGLGVSPTSYQVTPASIGAGNAKVKFVTVDATNINVTFETAPVSGTNNVSLHWKAEF